MIDIEAKVFDTVYNAVIAYDATADISSSYVESPKAFPHISCVEESNITNTATATLGTLENHARITYQFDIYSDKKGTAKSVCKGIAKVIDSAMSGMGFTRSFSAQVPNFEREIYRYTLRYDAVVSQPITVGTKTTYYTYQN